MASNLSSAKALIQADLDHARNVLHLWENQVAELESALTQLQAVDASRNMLRVEYQGQKGGAPRLGADPSEASSSTAPTQAKGQAAKTGRKSAKVKPGAVEKAPRKERASKTAAAPRDVNEAPARKAAKKSKASPAIKYKDPASDKTWSGRGRKPGWLSGDPDQYLISNLSSQRESTTDTSPADTAAS
jgi:DNA-binding protein H-NS